MIQVRSVSVVIPVYNCERYLPEAIESVLAQTYTPVELILIDDGSTDNSRTVAQGFNDRLRYFYQPHSGAAAARNYGIRLAQGDFLAFLDADDLWHEDKLRRQVVILDEAPELDMVFGHVQQFHTPELKDSLESKITFAAEVMPGYSCGSMLARRESFLRAGFFDPDRRMGEFIEWYLKAGEAGLKGAMMPDILLRRRLHENNMGVRLRDQRSEYLRIIKASLDRKAKKELV